MVTHGCTIPDVMLGSDVILIGDLREKYFASRTMCLGDGVGRECLWGRRRKWFTCRGRGTMTA